MADAATGDVTSLLRQWRAGDEAALGQVSSILYGELRRQARACMGREAPGHTLQPTALVHEAFLRLAASATPDWQNRAHFLAVAARTMRRVLIDIARAKAARKRGGDALEVPLDSSVEASGTPTVDLIALDEVLTQLEHKDARKARVIELRFFGGLTVDESAAVLDVSPDTVLRDWRLARAWLLRALSMR
jgi:RNA polymerase sigma factor (TIGR02999 family)